ncbi:MAG: C40 family peptidase [Bacteroidia bacterium]
MRKLLFVFCIAYFCASFSQTVNADSLVLFAKKHIGTRYKYGSTDPKKGFDCSGFVYYTFGHFNVKVPRASMDYEKAGRVVSVDSCRAGDVIVFTGTNIKNRAPGHVGIVVSNNEKELNFIHSSSGRKGVGVIITNFKDSPYYQSRFIKIVRLQAVTK